MWGSMLPLCIVPSVPTSSVSRWPLYRGESIPHIPKLGLWHMEGSSDALERPPQQNIPLPVATLSRREATMNLHSAQRSAREQCNTLTRLARQVQGIALGGHIQAVGMLLLADDIRSSARAHVASKDSASALYHAGTRVHGLRSAVFVSRRTAWPVLTDCVNSHCSNAAQSWFR